MSWAFSLTSFTFSSTSLSSSSSSSSTSSCPSSSFRLSCKSPCTLAKEMGSNDKNFSLAGQSGPRKNSALPSVAARLGPGEEETWYGTHTCKENGIPPPHRLNRSPSIQGHQCFEPWNSEKKRWQMYYTLQCGFVEHRTLISHKSAQYLRCSLKLVWRVGSVDFWVKTSWPWRSP